MFSSLLRLTEEIMSSLNHFRQKHRMPSRDQVRRRQAHHQFDRRTQRHNYEIPGLARLPMEASLSSQELNQGMAAHDIQPGCIPSEVIHIRPGPMCLQALVQSPHFQRLQNVQPQAA